MNKKYFQDLISNIKKGLAYDLPESLPMACWQIGILHGEQTRLIEALEFLLTAFPDKPKIVSKDAEFSVYAVAKKKKDEGNAD